jgi:hypothetical protein
MFGKVAAGRQYKESISGIPGSSLTLKMRTASEILTVGYGDMIETAIHYIRDYFLLFRIGALIFHYIFSWLAIRSTMVDPGLLSDSHDSD